MKNKLSSARALHAEMGVGLVRVHVQVVHSWVARYKDSGYLKQELPDGSPLSSKNSNVCYLEISNFLFVVCVIFLLQPKSLATTSSMSTGEGTSMSAKLEEVLCAVRDVESKADD